MADTKYHQDIDNCEEIGKILSTRLKNVYGNRRQAALRYAHLTGLTVSTSITQISDITKGGFGHGVSSESRVREKGMHLERLAIIYEIVGVVAEGSDEDDDHDLLALARDVNPDFKYPPEYEYHARPRDDSGLCILDVHFSEKDYKLTDEQLDDLKRRSVEYARSNLEGESNE